MTNQTETLNQLLTEMDGFKKNQRIIVIGATNRADILDPALKRPGRFDKSITIPAPDVDGREKLISYYASKIKHDKDIDYKKLAGKTSGFTGAMIKNYVN